MGMWRGDFYVVCARAFEIEPWDSHEITSHEIAKLITVDSARESLVV